MKLIFLILIPLCLSLNYTLACDSCRHTSAGKKLTSEELLEESQRNIDRTINIQNTTATFIEVLSGLVALIVTIAGLFGIFEYRRFKEVRNGMQSELNRMQEIRKKAEEEMDHFKVHLQNSSRLLGDPPSEENIKQLNEVAKRLDKLEILGVSFKPDDYINRGNDLFYKSDFENAIIAYDRAIELRPNDFTAYSNKSLAYSKLNLFEKSLESINIALQINPTDSSAWNTKGYALLNLLKYDEALASFEKAIQLNPNNILALNNKAHVLNKTGKWEAAIAILGKVLQMDPNNEFALLENGVALSYLDGKQDEAYDNFVRLTNVNPKSFLGWLNRAVSSLKLGDIERALGEVNEAIKLDVTNATAYDVKTNCLLRLNKVEEALESSNSALKLNALDGGIWYNRACVFGRLNQLDNSVHALKQAILIDPKFKEQAKNDSDFDTIKNRPEFQQLLN